MAQVRLRGLCSSLMRVRSLSNLSRRPTLPKRKVILQRGNAGPEEPAPATPNTSRPSVLVLDLDDVGIAEDGASPPPPALKTLLTMTGGPKQWVQLSEVVNALEYAGKDWRIQGLVACIGSDGDPMKLAQTQELRDAIFRFRELKQDQAPTVAYSDGFNDSMSGGTMSYYLASAFEQIIVRPSDYVSFSGLAEETPFMGRLLDKWQMQPQTFMREEYKNILNQFTHKGYTKAHREAIQGWLGSCMQQIVSGIAVDRGLSEKQVRAFSDSFGATSEDASAAGLIDGAKSRLDAMHYLSHEPDSKGWFRQRFPEEQATLDMCPLRVAGKFCEETVYVTRAKPTATLPVAQTHKNGVIDIGTYIEIMRRTAKIVDSVVDKPEVAVIRLSGEVISGREPLLKGLPTVNSKNVCEKLRSVAQDSNVKAVVLRIDSPGGDVAATEAINDEIKRLRGTGKPVIASMGNLAASAGYSMAAEADHIVAQPGTLTGSIGVAAFKFNLAPVLKILGFDMESVSVGKHAMMDSMFFGYSPEEKRWVDGEVDKSYDDFIMQVSARRNMDYEQLRKIAKGRIWTGADAFRLGLVDELGGLTKAVALAKQLAHLPEDNEPVKTQEWPPNLVASSAAQARQLPKVPITVVT